MTSIMWGPNQEESDREVLDGVEVCKQWLQATLGSTYHRDPLPVMSNLNVNISSGNVNYERVMGREGCGVQIDRLVCSQQHDHWGTIILFPHSNIHKLTWMSSKVLYQN